MPKTLDKFLSHTRWLFIILLFFHLPQCVSTRGKVARSEEFNRPLKDVRKAVYFALGSQVKNKSANNRTYYSHYHRPGGNLRLSAYKQKERAQVIFTLLGDRRPYSVRVLYKIESLKGRKYKLDRYDKSLAELYLERVESYLAGRPEERDIIDDFRAY